MPGKPDPIINKYDKLIYDTVISNGLPDNIARFIIAQSKFETGYNGLPYNSPVLKADNNLFGYKYVRQKNATQGSKAPANEGDYYARYKTPEFSVLEIVNWIKRRQRDNKFPADLSTIKDEKQYAQLLKNSQYYGSSASSYANGLTRWLKTINISPLQSGIGIGLIILLVSALYLLKK